MKRNRKIIVGIVCMLALAIVGTIGLKINMNASSNVGWVQTSNGSWNYVKNDGSKTTGWYNDNGTWYYFYSDGSMAIGWLQSGSNWYYMLKDGSMAVNTKVDGYYLNTSGAYSTDVPSVIYNGSDIKQKLYGLGFVDKNGGLTLNPYGAKGGSNYSQLGFTVGSGDRDMSLLIYQSSSEIDKKIRSSLNWILPTKGDYLYNVIDTKDLTSQTLELDGRTITIRVTSYGVALDFGPIK
jgi:FOG: Glucan-binding domain (YG repeat)